jgi:membrane protein
MRLALILSHNKGCFSTAKGAAYSGLLALFPVLSALAAVLVQMHAGPVQRTMTQFLADILPPGTEGLVLARFAAAGERPVLLLALAVLLAMYAASGLLMSLMEGFDAVYHVAEGRHFLKQRAVAAALVFGTAIPAVAASVLIVFGAQIEHRAMRMVSDAPLAMGVGLAFQAARLAVALGTVVGVTALLYHAGPNRRQRWSRVWPGALVATALWLVATAGFGWYVRNLANYNVMYGSLGTVIALLVWMYVMAAVSCVGCAYNAVLERSGQHHEVDFGVA